MFNSQQSFKNSTVIDTSNIFSHTNDNHNHNVNLNFNSRINQYHYTYKNKHKVYLYYYYYYIYYSIVDFYFFIINIILFSTMIQLLILFLVNHISLKISLRNNNLIVKNEK